MAHDDRLDALAMAVGYWVEQMASTADTEMKARRDELFDRELEKFRTNTLLKKDDIHDNSTQWFSL